MPAWYIIGLGALTIAWDIGARRAPAAVVRPRALRDAVWLPVTFIVIRWRSTSPPGAAGCHRTGYDRDYAQLHGVSIPVISPLYSLFAYHREAISFGLA